jgi:ATP-binding cassette, subfamily B, bacterial MsbA
MYLKVYQEFRDLFKKTKFWENNYLFLREFKTFRKIAILALVFSFLGATFEGISIGFLLSFLQNITTVNATPIHTGIEWFDIWVLGINTSAISRLYRISTLIILTTWMRVLFNYLGNLYTEIAQLQLGDRLRKQIFEQLEKVSLTYFSKTRSGDLINTITTEIEKIKYSFSAGSFLLTRTLNLSIYLITIIFISWQLTICSVLLFTLLGVALSTLNAKVREESFSLSSANSKFTSTAIEFINGIRTIQAFGTQQFERDRYYKASEEVVSSYTKVTLIGSLLKPITEGVGTTFLVGMIIFAFTVFVANGTLQVASLLGFFFILFRIVPIVQDVNGVRGTISMLQGSVDKVKSLLTTEDKVYFDNGTLEFKSLKRSIDLISVDFGYDAKNLVLHNITLSIERGKTTALVGGSGAGKTTLADIVARFYDPTEGNVLIDGTDLRQYEINTLRHKMAIVSQDTFIFNTSIWNNISYGTSEVREDEIREAARLANALEFILEMPEGFETQLGDRGVRLSGGQRQRIAIARALLRNPEILILDEATSALDSLSERLIQESLEKLSVGRTVIAIAHRLSTIAKADKVVVLEQGRLVEQGSYQELLNQRGKLWEYHKTQYQELGQTE